MSATVDSGAQGIVLTFKTQEAPDPATDPHWASPNTFVSWQVDSTGDGKVDDLIRYSLDRDAAGRIAGELTHWSGPGQPAKHCDVPATYDPTTGYTLTIQPSCMGNPAAISYRVQLTYDTNPSGTKPPLAFDVVPDQGLAGPVPIAVPTAPAAAPPAAEPPPRPATRTLRPDRPAHPLPAAPGAKTPAARRRSPPPRSRRTKPAAPAPGRGASTAAPKPAAPSAAPATEPSGELAATGPSSARWLGALGGALLLLGGLGLMTPADRRRRSTRLIPERHVHHAPPTMRPVVYVALLRGINVGGKTRIAMAALRDTCASVGCEDVVTYIQSGNVVLKSKLTPTSYGARSKRPSPRSSASTRP